MNESIKLLNDEIEQILQRRDALRQKHSGAVMPDEAASEDAQLVARLMKVREAKAVEEQKERDAAVHAASSEFNRVDYRLPHAVNADDAGRKTLERHGWAIKSGAIMRETSLGDYPMYPEEVLFGPLPDDMNARKYFEQTRAAIQPEYRDAYIKYIKLVAQTKSEALALNALTPAESKALSEGQDTAGGFLVPPDIQAEIFARTAQQSVMRQLCRVVGTSRDRVIWPRVEPAAATAGGLSSGGGSVFSSAFIGTWFGEAASQSDIDPKFGTLEINIRKIRVATRMSNDFISDAIANIPAFLATDGGRNMALVEDNGFLNGQGLGNPTLEPNGLLQDADVSTIDIEGTTANTVSNTTTQTGSAPKLIDVAYGLPSQYVQGASWLFRRSIEGKIRKLVDGSGRFLWPPMIASGFAAVTRDLLGNPVYNSDFMPADGTDTNKVVVFGDFSAYIIAQRAQITSTVLRERYADSDQTGIILWERVGGGLSNPDAFRFGIV